MINEILVRPGAEHIQVAAGVLIDAEGQILLTERPAGKPWAGYWEFPGGKIEAGESPEAALIRELQEELGITARVVTPLIRLRHDYGERVVSLHVYRVTDWQGELVALEQQAMQWMRPEDAGDYRLLPADGPIITALRLPGRYLISPPHVDSVDRYCEQLQASLLRHDISLFQLRIAQVFKAEKKAIASRLAKFSHQHGIDMLLNICDEDAYGLAEVLGVGMHLTSKMLAKLSEGHVGENLVDRTNWLAVSCHNEQELKLARKINADFTVLGPIKETGSHPGSSTLGWPGFVGLAEFSGLPVYALGGMRLDDETAAREHWGQGIAGIGCFTDAD